MKKLIILITVVTLSFLLFIYVYFTPKEYQKEYMINDFKIIEKFYKKSNYYEFNIEKDNYKFTFLNEHKYLRTRKLIEKIEIIEDKDNNIYCILPQIKNIDTYPLCYENNLLTNFSLINNEDLKNLYPTPTSNSSHSYQNIKISAYFNQTFLLWNYKGFYYINENTQKEINLFKNDIYDINLIAIVNNYLFIPNYDEEYKFQSAHLIDIETGESDIWYLDNEIYFDSYIMGSLDNSIYLYDKKSSTQYELVPHKKRMRKLTSNDMAQVWNIDKFESTPISKLNTTQVTFNYFSLYDFKSIDGYLYFNTLNSNLLTKISNLKDVKIIYQKNNTVFYLKNDKLYGYNPYLGETLLLEYFEWNFNNSNMIFIY